MSTVITNRPSRSRTRPPRVLLADPQKLVLDGLRSVLEPECEVVATVADGHSLVAQAQKLRPDLIVSEIALPGMDGIKAAMHIREILPDIKFIFVTAQADGTTVMSALDAGGAGYVLKFCSGAELKTAIRTVLDGKSYITSALKQSAFEVTQRTASKSPHHLTERECEVLKLVSQGHSYRTIAEVLRVSAKTVAFHKTNIKRKLAVGTTAELVKYAVRHGLVELA